MNASFAQALDQALNQMRPYIQGHGGDVSLVKFEEGVLYLKFMGACQSCPFSTITLKMGIEEQLKQQFPEISSVEMVD